MVSISVMGMARLMMLNLFFVWFIWGTLSKRFLSQSITKYTYKNVNLFDTLGQNQPFLLPSALYQQVSRSPGTLQRASLSQ